MNMSWSYVVDEEHGGGNNGRVNSDTEDSMSNTAMSRSLPGGIVLKQRLPSDDVSRPTWECVHIVLPFHREGPPFIGQQMA